MKNSYSWRKQFSLNNIDFKSNIIQVENVLICIFIKQICGIFKFISSILLCNKLYNNDLIMFWIHYESNLIQFCITLCSVYLGCILFLSWNFIFKLNFEYMRKYYHIALQMTILKTKFLLLVERQYFGHNCQILSGIDITFGKEGKLHILRQNINF